jgi:glycosyltransferase involved in cell wall biosynthesis
MPSAPRTVLGMPAYNRPDALPRVLESLLSQSCQDFALVIVDDAPSDEVRTPDTGRRFATSRILFASA